MHVPNVGVPPGSAHSLDTAKDIASHIFDEYNKLRDKKPLTEPRGTPGHGAHPAHGGASTAGGAGAVAVPPASSDNYTMTVSYL